MKKIILLSLLLLSLFLTACGQPSPPDLEIPQEQPQEVQQGEIQTQEFGTGYTKLTEKHDAESFDSTIEFVSEDTIKFNPEEDAYVIVERKMKYTSDEKTSMDGGVMGIIENFVEGRGELTETYSLEDAPVRFGLSGVDGFILTDPIKKNRKWVTYSHSGTLGVYEEQDDSLGFWLSNYDLTSDEINLTGQYIKGKKVLEIDSIHGKGELVVEFEYEIP